MFKIQKVQFFKSFDEGFVPMEFWSSLFLTTLVSVLLPDPWSTADFGGK